MQLHQPIIQLLQVNHPIKSFHVENPRSFNYIATRTHNKNKKYKSYICLQFSVTPSLELVHPVTSISDPAKTTTGKLTLSPDLIIPAPMEAHGVSFRRVLELAFCVAGIWSAYIYQGVLQETVIMSTKRFGPNKERFEHLAFLNFAQSSVCLIWSFMMIKLWPSKDTSRAPWWSYWSAGITNTIGPAMGIEALKYISYPAQVLAKSSKMIPG
ncbi:putative UAA transporter [Helianthus debilis subsp. tardiflorus]